MKESQEMLEVGERDMVETEQMWTPVGVISAAAQPPLQPHTLPCFMQTLRSAW